MIPKRKWSVTYNDNKPLEYAMRSGYIIFHKDMQIFMIITQRDHQPITMLNKSDIENPLAQKCSSQHFLTVGYLY